MQTQFIEWPAEGGSVRPQGAAAVRVGNLILVGSLLPVDAEGRLVAHDLAGQTRFVFDTLRRVLERAGATLADVVKHTICYSVAAAHADAALAEIDAVRFGYFPNPGPTTTEIRVGLDVEGALIQLDAWAVVNEPRERLDPSGHWSWSRPGPFVRGWKVGRLLFLSGQRSVDEAGRVLGEGDIEIQTDHAFRNLDTLLRAGGGDRHSLMKQNTYFRFFGQGREVTDYWEKMTNVRRRYMSIPSAAGAGLRIQGFPQTAELIQVEGIGALGADKQRLQPANHWDWSIPNTQFTQGWRIGPYAFIGGQISADNRARAVGHDMETQTRNVFQFIHNVLAEGGLDERDVIKLFIYYHGEGDWKQIAATRETIDRVQREFYGTPGPVSTSFRVAGFAFEDLLIEIEAFALARDGSGGQT
jgi:enamine deaminase RidA (YjgF/YER057c/UK114 family)